MKKTKENQKISLNLKDIIINQENIIKTKAATEDISEKEKHVLTKKRSHDHVNSSRKRRAKFSQNNKNSSSKKELTPHLVISICN